MEDVILRPIQEADLDEFGRYLSEPDAGGEFEWTGFKDPRAMRRRWEQDGWLGLEHSRLAVVSAGPIAGDVSIKDRSVGVIKGATYEIGIALFPEHRGKGVGTARPIMFGQRARLGCPLPPGRRHPRRRARSAYNELMSVVEEPCEPTIQAYDPDEAIARAHRLPPKEKLVLREVPDDEWAAFQSVLNEV